MRIPLSTHAKLLGVSRATIYRHYDQFTAEVKNPTTERFQKWLVDNGHAESPSKTFKRINDLTREVYGEDAGLPDPAEIEKQREKIKKDHDRLRSERSSFRKEQQRKQFSDADIKLIKNCLHPDRAPEKRQARFRKAFQAFSNGL